jgi:hypothetical protein
LGYRYRQPGSTGHQEQMVADLHAATAAVTFPTLEGEADSSCSGEVGPHVRHAVLHATGSLYSVTWFSQSQSIRFIHFTNAAAGKGMKKVGNSNEFSVRRDATQGKQQNRSASPSRLLYYLRAQSSAIPHCRDTCLVIQ